MNLKRNIVYHASSAKALTIDELSQLEQYAEWLQMKKGELMEGKIDSEGASEAE